MPLAWALTGGNRNDVTQLFPLVDRVPPVRGRRPAAPAAAVVLADRGYDPDGRRAAPPARHHAVIARRNTDTAPVSARYRWVVERTFSWLHQFKRLLVRYDRRADIHEAFLALGCCLICYRRLKLIVIRVLRD